MIRAFSREELELLILFEHPSVVQSKCHASAISVVFILVYVFEISILYGYYLLGMFCSSHKIPVDDSWQAFNRRVSVLV